MPGRSMTEPKAFASLGPMLLARKGTAKPAMRAQLGTDDRTDILGDELAELAASQAALGWDDRGEDDNVTPIARAKPRPSRAASRFDKITRKSVKDFKSAIPLRKDAAANSERRAAFTLRLDAERHLKLRLASAITADSAQALVTEALDRFLDDMPEIDALAEQAKRKNHNS